MTSIELLEIVAYSVVVLPFVVVLGKYMALVFSGEKQFLSPILGPIENAIYKICCIDRHKEHGWKGYLAAVMIINGLGIVFLFLILRLQEFLPLNPQQFKPMPTLLALNTAISFVTNTNWQAYMGENTLSYFSQMCGLTVQNFLSAATGMGVLMAIIRAMTGKSKDTIGNFYVDLVRSVIYVFLPLSIIAATLLMWQGVPQNISPYVTTEALDGTVQIIPQGPVASQIAIKQLGTNGGGFFGSNSAHPYENPTALSGLLQLIFMLLIPVALPITYGKMLKDIKHGYTIFGVMASLFVTSLLIASISEYSSYPVVSENITSNVTHMEGKEVRFGLPQSIFWSVATTATSNGSVNAMHDSFSPLAGMAQMSNIMLGEVVFGGIGSGLYGMLIFVVITVFMAGLMVGRTPEYLGKKIESYEMKMIMLALISVPFGVLCLGSLSIMLPAGIASIQETGPHGLSEVLYAYSSATGNNGSAFAGFNGNTNYHNIMSSIAMITGRFIFMTIILATAGSLVKKSAIPPSSGTLPTNGLQFGILLIIVVLVIGGITTFLPSVVLGPILEHILMINGKTF